ncbi:unannotated protein [freshwater metagenome]|uniref:Unannotated protein n=2 Tax=root TaxID=1 RepID=A0A6J7HH08_9ZZZZ
MIGLLGAKIWRENGVDFGNPLNMMPVAAGLIIAIGDTSLVFSDSFSLSGISLGTIVVIGLHHLCARIAPAHMKTPVDASPRHRSSSTTARSDGNDGDGVAGEVDTLKPLR